jgi:hypothetical protein
MVDVFLICKLTWFDNVFEYKVKYINFKKKNIFYENSSHLPHPFQITTHQSPYHLALRNLSNC